MLGRAEHVCGIGREPARKLFDKGPQLCLCFVECLRLGTVHLMAIKCGLLSRVRELDESFARLVVKSLSSATPFRVQYRPLGA